MLRSVVKRALRNGIFLAAVAEDVGVVSGELAKCRGLVAVERHAIRRGVVGVGSRLANQPRLQDGLLISIECGEVRRAVVLRPAVKQNAGLAMNPVGAPVGRDIGAVAPNRADLLAADGLPYALAVGDGVPVNRSCPSVV